MKRLSRRSRHSRLFPLLAATVCLACSPTSTLHVRFLCPTPIEPVKFFITSLKACPPAPILHAAPGTGGAAEYYRMNPVDGGVDVTAIFRGAHCRVQLTGWYDINADGNINGGDWVGSTPALDIGEGGVLGHDAAPTLEVRLERVSN